MGDLEGTGNVSVGLQQSHELLFSSHLPHQLDAHDQQHPLWTQQVLYACKVSFQVVAQWQSGGGRFETVKLTQNTPLPNWMAMASENASLSSET